MKNSPFSVRIVSLYDIKALAFYSPLPQIEPVTMTISLKKKFKMCCWFAFVCLHEHELTRNKNLIEFLYFFWKKKLRKFVLCWTEHTICDNKNSSNDNNSNKTMASGNRRHTAVNELSIRSLGNKIIKKM